MPELPVTETKETADGDASSDKSKLKFGGVDDDDQQNHSRLIANDSSCRYDARNNIPQHQHQERQQRKLKRRTICDRCKRPKPQTCICDALPTSKIRLRHVEIIVLQHPLEIKNHKATANRSVPLLELCLDTDRSLHLITGRRLGKKSLGPKLHRKLWRNDTNNNYKAAGCDSSDSEIEEDPGSNSDNNYQSDSGSTVNDDDVEYVPVLVFPKLKMEQHNNNNNNNNIINTNTNSSSNKNTISTTTESEQKQKRQQTYREEGATVYSLKELVHQLKQQPEEQAQIHTNNSTVPKRRKVLLLVLDATWKHAREMHKANIRLNKYPLNLLRLELTKEDLLPCADDDNGGSKFRKGRFQCRGKASTKGYFESKSKYNKEDPNSYSSSSLENAMSTAECVAWIVSEIEESMSSDTNIRFKEDHDEERQTSLYEILMKPLDEMVSKWKSFVEQNKKAKRDKECIEEN